MSKREKERERRKNALVKWYKTLGELINLIYEENAGILTKKKKKKKNELRKKDYTPMQTRYSYVDSTSTLQSDDYYVYWQRC